MTRDRTDLARNQEDDCEATRQAYDDDNVKANEYLYRRVDLEDVVSAHWLPLERAPSIGFGRYIITATTPFCPDDLFDLRMNAPLVVSRRVAEYEVEYARRGWKMFPSIDRVYVNYRAPLRNVMYDSVKVSLAPPIISISNLTKTYASGLQALKRIDLEIRNGEIFALLGPNGAGKTTLINIVCGIVTPSSGVVLVDGHDIVHQYRAARSKIGLVPQELTTDMFETVWATVSFSRGLFGRAPNPALIEKVLRDLSLWEKRDDKIMTLSGGMKRRVLIAKALSHEPEILFLDEPTAGVDVELRRDMWALVRRLREGGVTIILTTHYIDEAEEMADRIGVINKGELIVVEEKIELMKKLGKKQLTLNLLEPLVPIPFELSDWRLALKAAGYELEYTFDSNDERTGIRTLLERLSDLGIAYKDLNTRQSSLEDIFVSLVSDRK